jgi:hypothetical protein
MNMVEEECPITFFGGPSDGATIVRPVRGGYKVEYVCNSMCNGLMHAHANYAHYTALAWYEADGEPVSIMALVDEVVDY